MQPFMVKVHEDRVRALQDPIHGAIVQVEETQGASGRADLVRLLQEQKSVQGNAALAEKLANLGVPREVQDDEILIHEGERNSDLYFILDGAMEFPSRARNRASAGAATLSAKWRPSSPPSLAPLRFALRAKLLSPHSAPQVLRRSPMSTHPCGSSSPANLRVDS